APRSFAQTPNRASAATHAGSSGACARASCGCSRAAATAPRARPPDRAPARPPSHPPHQRQAIGRHEKSPHARPLTPPVGNPDKGGKGVSPRTGRGEDALANAIAGRITARDRAIANTLYEHRVLAAQQLYEL